MGGGSCGCGVSEKYKKMVTLELSFAGEAILWVSGGSQSGDLYGENEVVEWLSGGSSFGADASVFSGKRSFAKQQSLFYDTAEELGHSKYIINTKVEASR